MAKIFSKDGKKNLIGSQLVELKGICEDVHGMDDDPVHDPRKAEEPKSTDLYSKKNLIYILNNMR